MSLRVISGSARGRKLKSVPGDGTRPISDRVKESLFDILTGDVVDSTWWDIFAGTGAVGIEALSRGAAFCRFIDLDRKAVETITENLQHVGFSTKAEVRRGDAFRLLTARPDRQFIFAYIAPPQYQGLWSRALMALDDNPDWLDPSACVIVQIHPKEYSQPPLHSLVESDQRKYGNTLLIFYEKIITG